MDGGADRSTTDSQCSHVIEHSSRLDILVELCPTIPRLVLHLRLLECDDFDILASELVAEQQVSQWRGYTKEVMQLRQIFPNMGNLELAHLLSQNGGSVEAVTELLVSEREDEKLARVTGLPVLDAARFLSQNTNFHRALADIIANYRQTARVATRRVQGGGASPIATVLKKNSSYGEFSPEALELREMVHNNPELQKLNYDFLSRALTFTSGDVLRVIELGSLLLDAHAEQVTFDTKLGFDIRSPNVPVSASAAEILREKAPGITLGPKLTMKSEKRAISPSTQLPARTVPTSIDLHSMRVPEAVSAAKSAAHTWWAHEIHERTIEGRLSKYGKKVAFVQPLRVITGRGLHSVDGPRIRLAVIKLFTNEGYVFETEPGSLVLMGKR